MENMLDKQEENALDTAEEATVEACESADVEENTDVVAEPEASEELNEKECYEEEDTSEHEYLFEEVVEESSMETEAENIEEPSSEEDEETPIDDSVTEPVADNVEDASVEAEEAEPEATEQLYSEIGVEKTSIKEKKASIKFTTYEMVGIGIFSALAFVVSLFVHFRVQFLTFDAKDAVITIAAFVYGPLSATLISLIVAFIEMITVSDTMWYGFLMNFASSAIFATTASLIYRKKRNLNGAIIGLYSAIAATVGVMLLLNIFVTPLYFGLPVAAPMVMEMLPTLLLPFNFAKALMNSAIVMLIYKPVVTALKRLNIVKTHGGSSSLTFNKTTKIILALGAVGLALSITIFWLLIP